MPPLPPPSDPPTPGNAGEGPQPGPPSPRGVPAALAAVAERKRSEVREAQKRMTFAELEALVAQADEPRNFFAAVTKRPPRRGGDVAVIAEIARLDASGRVLRPEFANGGGAKPGEGGAGGGYDVAAIARRYDAGGAAAIAVATDVEAGGSLADVEVAREATGLPVLRRDVIVDPWQLWESRAAGADAVLLIADLLTEGELVDLLILSQQLRLTAIIEVRSMEALLRVRPHVGFPHRAYGLLGINNREMPGAASPEGDVAGTLRLLDMVDDLTVLVSEGGVRTREDVDRLVRRGVRIVLVGAEILRRDDPEAAIAELRGPVVR